MSELPQIDVACPQCGTEYHLSPDSAGQRMRCANRLCGATFTVPLTAEAVEPPGDEGARGPWAEIATLPLEAVVAEPPAATSPPAPPDGPASAAGRPRRATRRRRRRRRTKWVAAALLLVLAAVSAAMIPLIPGEKTEDERWAEITELFDQHKWSRVVRQMDKFADDFPHSPRIAMIPFFRDMCRAGRDIYSTTGNPQQGLASIQQIFRDHRDNVAYKQYCVDLFMALVRLIEEGFLKQAAASDPHALARAREAFALLETVNLAVGEDWAGRRTLELASLIEQAEHRVSTSLARQQAVNLLSEARRTDLGVNADGIYARVEGILADHPGLRTDEELKELLRSAYAAESSRPVFRREEDDLPAPWSPQPEHDPARDNTMVVVWGEAADRVMVWSEAIGYPSSAAEGEIVLALARGVLHAFDAKDGTLRWARRLGIDSHRLPRRIGPAGGSPAALIAVSTEQKKLLALEESSGKVRWQYPGDDAAAKDRDDLVAAPTIVDRPAGPHGWPGPASRLCGMLPTAGGEVHVLELAKGRRLGRYLTGQPMTVGGTYDPKTKLAFFPADAKRIFALDPAAIDDPQRPACRSILLTGHASGGLRSPPVVVGQYLIVSEAAELEHTRLRAFWLTPSGFRQPDARPQKELRLAGWAWFRPHCTPDRITLVTDEGHLGVFGLNLDNPAEALYRIVADWDLRCRSPSRPLPVHAQEHLLWVMAGGSLRKFSVDVVHKRIHPLWQGRDGPPAVGGIPIHEAQMDRLGQRFFLAAMSGSGRVYRFTAVESDAGTRLWQRQLGVIPLGDPLAWHDGALLIDQTGRTLALRPGANPQAGGNALPEEAAGGRVMRIDDPRDPLGPIHLVAPVEGGWKLAVCRVDPDPVASPSGNLRTTVPLRAPLQGRPCVCGGFLVVPCADGRLYRVPLEPGTAGEENEMAFSWSRRNPGPNRAEVYLLGPKSVLLVDGGRRLRRLVLRTEEHVLQWKESGEAFHLASPLVGRPLLRGDHAFLFDSAGNLYRLDVRNEPRLLGRWPLDVKVTRGPFVRGDYLLAIVDQRKLVCLPLDPPEDARGPLWTAEGFRGRICGMPALAADTLLVADNSRRVTGIRVADGKMVWKMGLEVRVGPSAAPVPCARHKMLVPLADGTLLELPVPEQLAAEASP